MLKAKVGSSNLCPDDLVRMNTDALALLGHAYVCFEITQRRRESIKANLHKDYAMLCSSNVPVTSPLFGDDLQAELTHIRATNKTESTGSISSPPVRSRSYQSSAARAQGRRFLGERLSRSVEPRLTDTAATTRGANSINTLRKRNDKTLN